MELIPSTTLSQRTTLAPRLLQSLNVLGLGAAEVMELVQRELCENPLLELPETGPEAGMESVERELWGDLLAANRGRSRRRHDDPATGPLEMIAGRETLADHLRTQLEIADPAGEEKRAALVIIDSLDEAGYLREPLEAVAAAAGVALPVATRALELVQQMDPPGIAARELGECLLNQMSPQQRCGLPGRIVRECLHELARGSLCTIARRLSLNVSQVEHATALICSLDPEPGARFDGGSSAPVVIPDVYVRRTRHGWKALANRELVPPLQLNRRCEQLAEAAADEKTLAYLREKRERARRLIKDLEQRQTTIVRVAEAIAAAQADFLVHGSSRLRPLKLDDIASRLGVSASTVSRASREKYMSTPQGVFEFKYFFDAGPPAADGGRLAATAVKHLLRQLIEGEDRSRPLSDRMLAEKLRRENVEISRRTVAKYREEMGVPPSCRRKVS